MTIDTSTLLDVTKMACGVIGTLIMAIIALVLMLHKDMKKSIDKNSDLLHPLIRQVDIHEASIKNLIEDTDEIRSTQKEHEQVHRHHHDRISKLENKVL